MTILFCCAACLGGSGCARRTAGPRPGHEPERPFEIRIFEKDSSELSPRARASLQLIEKGRMLLESGKSEDAIMTLEQAINLNPANGLSYYYLAEAWLLNGKLDQAAEFNGLASLYLAESPGWRIRIKRQKERIQDHKN